VHAEASQTWSVNHVSTLTCKHCVSVFPWFLSKEVNNNQTSQGQRIDIMYSIRQCISESRFICVAVQRANSDLFSLPSSWKGGPRTQSAPDALMVLQKSCFDYHRLSLLSPKLIMLLCKSCTSKHLSPRLMSAEFQVHKCNQIDDGLFPTNTFQLLELTSGHFCPVTLDCKAPLRKFNGTTEEQRCGVRSDSLAQNFPGLRAVLMSSYMQHIPNVSTTNIICILQQLHPGTWNQSVSLLEVFLNTTNISSYPVKASLVTCLIYFCSGPPGCVVAPEAHPGLKYKQEEQEILHILVSLSQPTAVRYAATAGPHRVRRNALFRMVGAAQNLDSLTHAH
jgi:hypothetical protein